MPGCSWNLSEAWIICIKIGQHSGLYESILCNSCQYFYTWESSFILYYFSGINIPIALTKCYTSIIGISLGSKGYQHQSHQLHTSLTLFHFSSTICIQSALCSSALFERASLVKPWHLLRQRNGKTSFSHRLKQFPLCVHACAGAYMEALNVNKIWLKNNPTNHSKKNSKQDCYWSGL